MAEKKQAPISMRADINADKAEKEKALKSALANIKKQFGEGAVLSPANLIDSKRFEIKTADATVSVEPERSYIAETRFIDGKKYLLIPVGEGLEVNGLSVE